MPAIQTFMHYHELIFTKNEAATLHKEYETLLHKLGQGKKLYADYLGELTETMRALLYNQAGLKPFWQQVGEKPQEHYHLHLTHTDKTLLNLPWQMAIDEELHPFVYVSKGSADMESLPVYQPKEGPLKILVMISSPADHAVERRLSYEEEEDAILQALVPLWEKGQVQISFTSDGSLHSLEQQLAAQHYHVLYFSGHGVYKYNTGYLLLENKKTSENVEVTAEQFAKSLAKKRAHLPALVVLASCQTAQGAAEEGFPGVADELIAVGVPAVIAMAFSISDRYATVFAAQLHQQLAQQEALLPAYGKALRAMAEEEETQAATHGQDHAPTQWLVPQLYYHQQVKHIVDWKRSQPFIQSGVTPWGTPGTTILLEQEKNYRFIGRRRESARLLAQLHLKHPVLLRGQAGVGKTALAEHLASRLMAYDGAYHVFAFDGGTVSIQGMINGLKEYLKKQERPFDTPSGGNDEKALDHLLQEVSKLCKPVWIFDNIDVCQESMGGPLQAAWQPWMDYTRKHLLHQFPVIFTCRYGVPELGDVFNMLLTEAPPNDLYTKLRQLSIRHIIRDYPESNLKGIVELLYNAIGGNYRALQVFDGIYTSNKAAIGKLLEKIRLEKDPNKIYPLYEKISAQVYQLLDTAPRKPSFGALLYLLNKEELDTLLLLANYRRPVKIKALDKQKAGAGWKAALEKLKDLTLIEEQENPDGKGSSKSNYFFVPILEKAWLQKQKLKPGLSFSHEEAGDYFYVIARDSDNSWDYTEAFWHFMQANNTDKVNETGVWLSNGYTEAAMYEQALQYALYTLHAVGERVDPFILNNIALVYRAHGETEAAMEYLVEFLSAARRKKDKVKEGFALHNLGALLVDLGKLDEAVELLEQGVAIAQKTGDTDEAAKRLNSLARVLYLQNDHKRALKLHNKSLDLRRAAGDRPGEAHTLLNLSDLYYAAGDHKKTFQSLQFCLQVFKEYGDKEGEGAVYKKLGSIYSDLADYDKALDYLTKALVLQRSLRNKPGVADALTDIAGLLIAMGRYEDAFANVEKTVSLFQSLGHGAEEAHAWNTLSGLYRKNGQLKEAIKMAEEGLNISREIGELKEESESLFHLAMTYQDMGNSKKSKSYFKKSKAVLEQMGATANMELLDAIDRMLSPQDTNKALKLLQKSLAAYRAAGKRAEEAGTLHEMAGAALASEDMEQFFTWEMEAFNIYTDIQHQEGIFVSGSSLGYILYERTDTEEREQGLELLQYCFRLGKEAGFPEAQEIADYLMEQATKH